MMRRLLATLLAALLALGGAAALAEDWTCPACGTQNTGNFCVECGAAKPARDWTCPACGTQNTGNFCTECGAAKPVEDWTCPACGTQNTGNFCVECGATKPAAPIEESGYDALLDAAFDAGSIRFTRVAVKLPDPATCALAVPEEFWSVLNMKPLSEDVTRLMLADGTFTPVSISPDGIRAAGMLQVEDFALPVAVSPNRVAILSPTQRRGAADAYGSLSKIYKRAFLSEAAQPMNMGQEGMIWSPDGRYFCALNCRELLVNLRFDAGAPIIADNETGEMFLLDAYPTQIRDGGAILTGRFSQDGRGFYALYYGAGYDSRCILLRYDLQTCEKEVCGPGMDNNGYPSLAQLRDGSLLTIRDEVKQSLPQGLAKFAPDGNTTFQDMPANAKTWYASYIDYSRTSGWMAIRGRLLSELWGFQLTRPDESLSAGLDAVWVISAGNLTPGFIRMATVKKLIDSGDAQGFRALADKCLPVGDVRLSPDGRYAAVLTGTAQAPFVLIVRLEDMEALVAEGIDLGAGNVMTEGETGGVWWSESGLLVKGQKGITLWAIEG